MTERNPVMKGVETMDGNLCDERSKFDQDMTKKDY